MKKKYVRKFNSLFDCLIEAGEILSGKYDENHDEKRILSSKVSSALIANREIIDDPESRFLNKVFDEIDTNLYDIPSGKEEHYFKDLLRGFVGIMPYLDPFTNIEWNEPEPDFYLIGDKYFPAIYGATLNLILGLTERSGEKGDVLTDVEEYVLSCSELLLLFANSLDPRCLKFDLDLFAIQEELNIFILRERNLEMLVNSGYEDKVMQLISKHEAAQRALPNPLPDEAETMLTFPEYLRHKKPGDLAALCISVFAKKQSPKVYAIMLSLLALNSLIYLADKQRKDFYESWYTYIGRPFPKNGNFYSINKHIDTGNNFQFLNDTDAVYVNLKRIFDLALKKLTLVK